MTKYYGIFRSFIFENVKKYILQLNVTGIILFAVLLLYKLGTVPNLFVDEVNYMNEVISLANFGTDIHGVHFPVYFSSVWGQGQSVLYAVLAYPLVKLFGFSITIFRLPMVFLTVAAITIIFLVLFFKAKNKKLATIVNLVLLTTPWIFTSSRWVLDANVAPVFLLIGTIFVYLCIVTRKNIFLFFGAVFIGLTAYGYIAAWLYLPILCIAYVFFFLKHQYLNAKQYLILFITVCVVVFPIIVFAYQSNVAHSTKVIKLLFFNLPPLPAGRSGSLINFENGHIFSLMIDNFNKGLGMYFRGTDDLFWNSVQPFGALYPWLLIFAPIGMFFKSHKFNQNAILFQKLFMIGTLSFLPLMFVVIPNYNHWNFLNINLAILIGYGVYIVVDRISGLAPHFYFMFAIISMFICFLNFGYFGFSNRQTYYEQNQVAYTTMTQIDNLMNKHRGRRLYLANLSSMFPYFRLVQKPITSNAYLNKMGRSKQFDNHMGSISKYGYLRDVSEIGHARSGDYALMVSDFHDKHWSCVEQVILYGQAYCVLQKK